MISHTYETIGTVEEAYHFLPTTPPAHSPPSLTYIIEHPTEFLTPDQKLAYELEKAAQLGKAKPTIWILTEPATEIMVRIENGWAKALAMATGLMIESFVAVHTEIEAEKKSEKRRRVKTQACVAHCFSILHSARMDLQSGWMKHRALMTENMEPRKWRRFRSRKN